MRRPLIGLAVALGFSLMAPASRAQGFGNFNDPFTFYYGFYLPHQAAIAAQPTPMDTINAVTAARQFTAPTNRTGMFDPVSPYGVDDSDLFSPGGPAGGRGRGPIVPNPAMNSNARGTGPALYYNRTARYFPGIRVGRSPNSNISVGSPRRGVGGGGGGIPVLRCPVCRGASDSERLNRTDEYPTCRDFELSGGFNLGECLLVSERAPGVAGPPDGSAG